MINRVVLVGRLTKDPDLKYTQGGLPVARFTVAVNRTHKTENNEREADFISCVAWRKQAENLANFMKKGNLIGVEGRIQTGSYEGQDGKKVYTTEIVADAVHFLEKKDSTQPSQSQSQQQQYDNGQPNYNQQQQYGSQPNYNQQKNAGGQQQYGGQPNYGGQQAYGNQNAGQY